MKAANLHESITKEDLVFTAPISISKNDFEQIRKNLLSTITEISKVVTESKDEEVVYLGIDWIKL